MLYIRFSAQMLEGVVVRVASRHLTDPGFAAKAILDVTPGEAIVARGQIAGCAGVDMPDMHRARSIVSLIARIDIAPGQLTVRFDPTPLAGLLGVKEDRIDPDSLSIGAPFTMRRRGVETKLILGDVPQPLDRKLIANIATALSWLDRIKSGKTYAEVAVEDGVPKYRVQQAICYAFLAPDVIRQILQGRQPLGLTSKWIFRHDLPMDWAEQRSLISTL